MFDHIERLGILRLIRSGGHSNSTVAKFPSEHDARFPKQLTYSNMSDTHIYMCKSRG